MATRNRQNRRRKANLKKETIRRLDLPELPPEDLAEVAGGYVVHPGGKVPLTAACITCQ